MTTLRKELEAALEHLREWNAARGGANPALMDLMEEELKRLWAYEDTVQAVVEKMVNAHAELSDAAIVDQLPEWIVQLNLKFVNS